MQKTSLVEQTSYDASLSSLLSGVRRGLVARALARAVIARALNRIAGASLDAPSRWEELLDRFLEPVSPGFTDSDNDSS